MNNFQLEMNKLNRDTENFNNNPLLKLHPAGLAVKRFDVPSTRLPPLKVNSSCENPFISTNVEIVQDIDAYDREHYQEIYEPMLVEDIYEHLRIREKELSPDPSYMAKQFEITPRMRSVLFDWLFEVVSNEFQCSIETYLLTVAVIDDYSSHCLTIKKSEYQLVGIASLHLAMKYEEISLPSISELVLVCDRAYTSKQITSKERDICENINYHFVRPSIIDFLRRFNRVSDVGQHGHILGKYLILISTIDYGMTSYLPSMIAAATVYLEKRINNQKPYWNRTMEHYSGYCEQEIIKCARDLRLVHKYQNTPSNDCKSIREKFSDDLYKKCKQDWKL
ncbi:G2/mitotic-specific cyclin-B [Entamoeba marina]